MGKLYLLADSLIKDTTLYLCNLSQSKNKLEKENVKLEKLMRKSFDVNSEMKKIEERLKELKNLKGSN